MKYNTIPTSSLFLQEKYMLNGVPPPRVRLQQRKHGTSRLAQNHTPFKRMAATFLQIMTINTDRNVKRSLQLIKPNCFLYHIYNAENGSKETIDSLLTGTDAIIWNRALLNEWGRLAK